MTESVQVSDAQLRRWLSLLRRPDQLSSPELRDLLAAHRKLPASPTSAAIGHAAASLFITAIERLRPPADAPRDRQIPYLVLKTCFIDGAKVFQAAAKLGLSERQMTRERARAIALMRAELEAPLNAGAARGGEPIPTITTFLPRPGQTHALQEALDRARMVNVFGPMGIGKTALVADLAAWVSRETPVFWYRMRPQVNVKLVAFLFELGQRLQDEGMPELSEFLTTSMPNVDTELATRVAVQTLSAGPLLICIDDYHHAEQERAVGPAGFLDEIVARLPRTRVVTISRYRYTGTSGEPFEVPPLSRLETTELLTHLGVECQPALAKTLHAWTGGNPHLVKLAASWLKTATGEEIARGVSSLNEQEEVHAFLLEYITQLLSPEDKSILEVASIFRDRFSDEALAFVSGRTRGEIVDASLRLARVYVATRSREGDTAFFHNSVRDHVYARIDPIRLSELHERAALWYRRAGRSEEAEHHDHQAEAALEDLDVHYSA